jgi:hypothetical protein
MSGVKRLKKNVLKTEKKNVKTEPVDSTGGSRPVDWFTNFTIFPFFFLYFSPKPRGRLDSLWSMGRLRELPILLQFFFLFLTSNFVRA